MAIRFSTLCFVTLVAVYCLIGIGSIVRVSGAGMGCPDWPTCFGKWIPPLYEHQLPENYQEIYKDHGYADQPFNALKTWTEYLNRLAGVTIGFLSLLTFLQSLKFWRDDRWVTIFSSLAFLLVLIQGYIGALVVRSNLQVNMVSLHMALAVLVIVFLTLAYGQSTKHATSKAASIPKWKLAVYVALGLTSFQLLLGTQVREAIDILQQTIGDAARESWIDELALPFFIHRSFSWILIGITYYIYKRICVPLKHTQKPLYTIGLGIWVIILMEVLSGVILAYFGLPRAIQPLHLVMASLLVGLQTLLALRLTQVSESA